MKNEDFSKLSLEELKKKEKSTRFSAGLLGGIIFVQFLIGIFLTVTNGFSVFTVMPIAFLPILVISFSSLKKIKAEIATRNN